LKGAPLAPLGWFTLKSLGHLDENMGEPIGYGSNAFVPSINPI